MKMQPSFLKKLAIPAAVLPFLAPMAAFAAEGTGRVSTPLITNAISKVRSVSLRIDKVLIKIPVTTGLRHR